MKLLIIDNYDSFTYNLVQYFREIGGVEISIIRNDKISLTEVDAYDAIVLSPGPGVPKDAGIMPELIKAYGGKKPIFGVCLGLQAIGEAYGGELHNLEKVYHGISSKIKILDKDDPLFVEVEDHFDAGRYHSWVVTKEDLPSVLKVTAVDENGMIMALRHQEYNISAVQFHPESIMTTQGKVILKNFLVSAKSAVASH